VVPEVKLLKLTDVAAPEQIVAVVGVAVANGIGLTVTITGTDEPVHEFALGTILYVTVPEDAPVVKRVCAIVEPVPEVPPVAAV
jgi:hypothetical protein